ncbi:hypothetical protein MLD52_11325 [Puniceicoccaceae bacterium K14]|nr:hypothetical protein [Puniceicoccaceae bacterium K14]
MKRESLTQFSFPDRLQLASKLVRKALEFQLCLSIFAILLTSNSIASLTDEELFLDVPKSRLERIASLAANFDPQAHFEIHLLEKEYPESPLPLILELNYLYWKQHYVSYEVDLVGQFEKTARDTLLRLSRYTHVEETPLATRFSVAYAKGLLGTFYLERGRKREALRTASASIRGFKRLLKLRNDFPEAKLSVGLAHCYNFDQTSMLKSLLSPKTKQSQLEHGLSLILEASENSSFCKADAQYYYAKILREELSEEEQAKAILAELLNRYPRNLHYRTVLAGLERSTEDFLSCCFNTQTVLSDERITQFPGIQVQALNHLMWSAYEINEYELCLESALRLQKIASSYPELEATVSWAKLAEAESLHALGFQNKATNRWQSIPTIHKDAYRRAQSQLDEKLSRPIAR